MQVVVESHDQRQHIKMTVKQLRIEYNEIHESLNGIRNKTSEGERNNEEALSFSINLGFRLYAICHNVDKDGCNPCRATSIIRRVTFSFWPGTRQRA